MKRIHRPVARRRKQQGSALLVSLMVMVGLSLLGLGFVAISQTENTISVNERNYAQVLSVAEGGARLCLEWFQAPDWARNNNLMPLNTNSIKTLRVLTSGPMAPYTGYYKSDNSTNVPFGLLCDKPFKAAARHRFLGDEDNPDVLINEANSSTFLATFNDAITSPDRVDGQVTEIRLFAPPIVGGTKNGGFWAQGTRYGLCTIRVTAQKIVNGQVLAQRTVKTVISEWPFPGPQGPVQSNANIQTGGAVGVHWGRMTAELTMFIKNPLIGLPWHDAWSRIHFERGYYTPGQNSNGNANDATLCDGSDWLYQLTARGIDDPWFEARAKGAITNAAAGTAFQPFKVTSAALNILNVPDYGYSNWFQNQDIDDVPSGGGCDGSQSRKLVVFPKIDYEFWKNLSRSSTSSNSAVHYLSWVAGETYTDGVSVHNVAEWTNTVNGRKPGFYFFDTRNGLNPQGTAAPGILAPDVTINSSDDGSTYEAQGFVYMNVASFGTTGIGGPGGWYNFPGEPYRDIGYTGACDATNTPVTPTTPGPWQLCTGPAIGADDGEWDGQDLNDNAVKGEVFVAQYTRTRPDGTGTVTSYYPVPWSPGCVPGTNNATVGGSPTNCSEPHEPFLNLVYPVDACCAGAGKPNAVTPMWEAPASQTRRSKVKNSSGTPVTCSVTALVNPASGSGPQVPDPTCTSNAYDRDGSLVYNFGGPNTAPILDGVLYNEGNLASTGNASFFGSLLINGDIDANGTPEVWFDELLIKGGWQDKFKDMPRVFVTAHETDQ